MPDFCDPCPHDPLDDSDGDGVCDSADVCPGGDDRVDRDADGVPDFCDPCPHDPLDDSDGDGVCDSADVCPGGDDRVDRDADGVPDFCDPCPHDPLDDSDGDGVCDSADVCPSGDDNVDGNNNGVPDDCEPPADSGGAHDAPGSSASDIVTRGDSACGAGVPAAAPIGVIGLTAMGFLGTHCRSRFAARATRSAARSSLNR